MTHFKKLFKDELIKFLINYINKNQYAENYEKIKDIIIQFLDDNYVIDKSLLSMFFVYIIKKNDMINTYSTHEADDSIVDHEFQLNSMCFDLFDDDMYEDSDINSINSSTNTVIANNRRSEIMLDNIIIEHLITDYELNIDSNNISNVDDESDQHNVFFISSYKYPLFTYIKTWLTNYISDIALFILYASINIGVASIYYSRDYIDRNLFKHISDTVKISKMSAGVININIIICFLSISSLVDKFYKIMPWWFYSCVPLYRFKTIHYASGTIFFIAVIVHVAGHIFTSFTLFERNNLCAFTVLKLDKLGLDKYKFYNYWDYVLTYPYISGFIIMFISIVHIYFVLRINNNIFLVRSLKLKPIRHSIFLDYHWKLSIVMVTTLLFHGLKQWLAITTNWAWTLWFIIYYLIENRFRIFGLNESSILHITNYHDKLLELTINKPKNIKIDSAGMSFLLNIPSVHKKEWHPFTIDYNTDSIIFFIEVVGQWSTKLKDMSMPNESGYQDLYYQKIYLSRCYNNIVSYINYYNISIVFVFGICITSLVSFLKETIRSKTVQNHTKKIYVIWTLNDINILYIFKDLINEVIENEELYNISFHIFITQKMNEFDNLLIRYLQYKSFSKNNIDVISGLKNKKIYFRRPNIPNIIKNTIEYSNNNDYHKKIGVFLCGSPPMQTYIKDQCNEHNYNIYNISLQFHKVQ